MLHRYDRLKAKRKIINNLNEKEKIGNTEEMGNLATYNH